MQPSDSDAPVSAAFARLHPKVQRWVWEQQWTSLREVQEAATGPILDGEHDVVITAATAGGKTEAAFLPICSRLAGNALHSIGTLYVSPLKALINDQYDRLELLCRHLDIPVHRWHGDVSASRKKSVIDSPQGILIITPESLEALFVTRGPQVRRLFDTLVYTVVDELHAFMGTERGRQLQSLLHRLELAIGRRVPRIALSATLGDMELACEFLRPAHGPKVTVVSSSGGGSEVRLLLKGYRQTAAAPKSPDADGADEEDVLAIAEDLYQKLRGTDNLVFANSRARVERFADLLRRLCERRRVPNEFWPHHGNLARELREDVESILKDPTRPATVVCTTTLEMGIDIGEMASIAQIGAPPSVTSLRQRLGRSGRRGGPAVLRMYVEEGNVDDDTPPQDALRVELVQTIAMIRLLLVPWYEPPPTMALHLSTLVQQTLSLIAERGGIRPDTAWRVLAGTGPFVVDQSTFSAFLRSLAAHDLIEQASDGTLLLGGAGERLTAHYGFYSAFATPDEYTLVAAGHALGTLPIDFPVDTGTYLIFAGRRWRVLSVDAEARMIEVAPAVAGRLPRFTGGSGEVHDRVREEMRTIYRESDVPVFLDGRARQLLTEGRAAFLRHDLDRRALIAYGEDTLLFCWAGDRVVDTVQLLLRTHGLSVQRDGIALTIEGVTPTALGERIRALVSSALPDPTHLARSVDNKRSGKYDGYLDEDLLSTDYASRRLDTAGARRALHDIAKAPH